VNRLILFALAIFGLLFSSSFSFVFAALENDLNDTAILARENRRTMERVGDFTQKSADRMGTEPSLISTCDSLIQKLNIDVGKHLVENQAIIEKFLYPYFLPSSIHTLTGLSSANVTGSTDRTVLAKHLSIFLDYSGPISDISDECLSRASSYDMGAINSCISIVKSLNSQMKVFNQNARSEFERVLYTAIP
jgi:hypothetical protein